MSEDHVTDFRCVWQDFTKALILAFLFTRTVAPDRDGGCLVQFYRRKGPAWL